jgi:superfamily II DNA/RNA helicase
VRNKIESKELDP